MFADRRRHDNSSVFRSTSINLNSLFRAVLPIFTTDWQAPVSGGMEKSINSDPSRPLRRSHLLSTTAARKSPAFYDIFFNLIVTSCCSINKQTNTRDGKLKKNSRIKVMSCRNMEVTGARLDVV
jgi:hypothetical protein